METFVPKGYILLREVIVRLAVLRVPNVDVRGYLALQPALHPGFNFSCKWRSWAMSPDPFISPPTTGHFADNAGEGPTGTILAPDLVECPAWSALEAARAEMWQALGDGDLEFYRVGEREEMLGIPAPDWRGSAGLKALGVGAFEGGVTVFAHERRFAAWVTGPADRRPTGRSSPHALAQWMDGYMQDNPRATREKAIDACNAATGASKRSACRTAWNSLPRTVKGGQGGRKSS